jgi:hypothetical protein
MKTYQITLPDHVSEEALQALLATLGIRLEQEEDALIQGNFSPTDKPANFVPIWDNDERTLENIREKAWKKR